MEDIRLGAVEQRFAELIWNHAPIASGELVKLCAGELNWKKPTTYTVLRKLCQRGLFQNIDGIVTPLLTRQQFRELQTRQFVQETFGGSLPAFLAAFTAGKGLTPEEAEEIRRMIREA